MDRRGFLTLLGGAAIATPAMVQTAGGVVLPAPQRIIGDRLVIEDMVLRGITIRNCYIIAGGMSGIEITNCHIEGASTGMMVANSVVRSMQQP